MRGEAQAAAQRCLIFHEGNREGTAWRAQPPRAPFLVSAARLSSCPVPRAPTLLFSVCLCVTAHGVTSPTLVAHLHVLRTSRYRLESEE